MLHPCGPFAPTRRVWVPVNRNKRSLLTLKWQIMCMRGNNIENVFFPAGKRTLSKSEPLELHDDQHSKCSLKNHTWTSMYFLILSSESVINQVLKQFFGCFELLNQFLGVVIKLKDATYVKSKQKISVIIKKNPLCNVTRLVVFQHCLKAPREQRRCFKIYPL